jgi:AraC-like DNA-binding protein
MNRINIQTLDGWLALARESSFRVKVLSRKLSISQRQLQRYTQKVFRRSPQELLNEQRLTLAVGCLKEERSVKSVAFQLGFKQASHFSREFKAFYGLPPTAFLNNDWPAGKSSLPMPGSQPIERTA